jgi:hypothetical protein
MDADIEHRMLFGEQHGVSKLAPIGHQGSGGENTAPVRVDNAFVDIPGKAEIIGIHDQTPHQQDRRT